MACIQVLGSGITSRIKKNNIITADSARFSKLYIPWTDVSSKVKRLHYIDIMLSILLNIILALSTKLSAWEKAYSAIVKGVLASWLGNYKPDSVSTKHLLVFDGYCVPHHPG